MSESIITLWINSETNSLLPSWNSFGIATIPSIKQGDSAKVEIHWIKSDQSGNFMSEVAMSPTSTLKLAVGSISGVPTEGYFTYNYQGDTVQIPYDADVESVPPTNPAGYVEKNANTLINSLPSIIASGGVVVSIVNQRTLRIVFNNFGARALSSCNATTLRPSTNVSVTRISTGGPSTKEVQHLRPKVLPIAYTDSFSLSPSPVISITNIDSITKRISITPQPKFGTFTISNGTLTTGVLSINSSASDVLSALSEANINSETRLYSVAKSGDYSWDIYRTSGTAETLTVTDSGMIGFESKFGVIDFNTIELEDYLGGAERANATIEVEYSDGTIRQTLYQGTVLIVNDLIEDSVYSPIPFPELSAGIGEAPMDGTLYGRKDGVWSSVIGDLNNIPDYDNSIVYTVGNQVYFQGKLYRMQIASGVAGDDPVASPSYWESLSGNAGLLSTGITMDADATIALYTSSSDSVFITGSNIGINSPAAVNQTFLTPESITVSNPSGSLVVDATGIRFRDATIQTTAAVTPDLSGYALLSGATFTGKVNTTQTTTTAPLNLGFLSAVPTTTVAGDLWVGDNLNFKDKNGLARLVANASTQNTFTQPQIIAPASTATLPALRITQTGAGNALVVEDKSNPDTSSFIVNNDGLVGIGVSNDSTAPWTPTHKLEVNGSAIFNGKLNTLAPDATSAGLNIGYKTGTSLPTTTVAGDVFINDVYLSYKDANNTQQTVLSSARANNIFLNATVSGTNTPLTLQQSGQILGARALIVNGLTSLQNPTTSNANGTLSIFNESSGPALKVTTGSVTTAEVVVIESSNSAGTALRITNTGNSNSIVVEDATNPDASAFIVNADGKVGIGVASGYTPVGKLDVNGFITSTTATDGTDSTVVATTAFVKTATVPSVQSYGDGLWLPIYVTAWNSIVRLDFTYNQSVQLPTNAQNTAIVGTQVVFLQLGSGRLNFTPTNGNTVMSAGGKYITNQQYSVITAIKTGSNEWLIAGDLSV